MICCYSEGLHQKCDLAWRHNKIQFKNTDTDKQVTKRIQKQREVAHKTKQAYTATISTTVPQMSLDSSNPSSRLSTGVPVPSLPMTRKDKSPRKDRYSGRASNMFDVLDDKGGEIDISSLHHPTTKPQSKIQIIPMLPP